MIQWMLERLESNPRTVFLQSDLARMFPTEFHEARQARLVRPRRPGGDTEFGVFFAGRFLTVVQDGGDLVGFDDNDPEFDSVVLAPADIQAWILDLDSLSREMQRLNSWSGRPGRLTDRLHILGVKPLAGRQLTFLLGLFRHDDIAEKALRQLVKDIRPGDVTVILSADYEPPPLLREELRTHAVVAMRLPSDLKVPNPSFRRVSVAVLPGLTDVEEREFLKQGFLCRVGVHLPGRRRKQRMIVEVDGEEVELALTPYRLFLRLLLGMYTEPGGWVDRGKMKHGGGLVLEGYYTAEGIEQALSRLRSPFSTALGPTVNTNEFLEARDGKLRISTHPRYMTWDRDQLLAHEDDRVSGLLARLRDISPTTPRQGKT